MSIKNKLEQLVGKDVDSEQDFYVLYKKDLEDLLRSEDQYKEFYRQNELIINAQKRRFDQICDDLREMCKSVQVEGCLSPEYNMVQIKAGVQRNIIDLKYKLFVAMIMALCLNVIFGFISHFIGWDPSPSVYSLVGIFAYLCSFVFLIRKTSYV
jgi:hypothetical protein